MAFLGVDLGTSGIRLLLIDAAGRSIGATQSEYKVSYPKSGWSEQHPKLWIDALEAAIAEMRGTFPEFADLQAIAVSGQMHGATLLDENGDVLRPCILWNDTRSSAQAARLDAIEEVRTLSGNIVFPGFTAPKLEWVRENELDIFARVAKVLLPAAYLNYYLTGDYVADMSDSAGTSWLDTGKREWSDILLAASHMRRDQMPRLVEGCEPAGILRAELAQKWSVKNNVVIAGGAGDNAAAAAGIGALEEGQGFVSLGTSGVLLAARDGYHPAPETALHTFCHAVPGRWYQMGVMLSATNSLNWLSQITGVKPSALTAEIGDTLQAPGTVQFLPYLSGERTPHNDAEIRGAFTGLSAETSREDLTRAVLEGVAFGLRDSFEALRDTDAKLEQVFAIGGGTGSDYWLKLIATVLQMELHLPGSSEFGAALGAARLAQIAASDAAVKDIITAPQISRTIKPEPTLSAAYDEAYARFKRAYVPIKEAQ